MDRVQLVQFREALKELENLEALRTSSVLSLHLPSSSSLILVKNRIEDEQSRAANIKSVSNRSSVQEALKSAVDMLSTVNAMPPHGLLVFYGQSVLNKATGEVSRLRRTLTPPQPVQEFKYDVSKTFSTHSLHQLLISQEGGVGYIVIDGSAVALGTLSENGLKVHHHENVDIPKKHGRGGQSAPRFQRIRLEKRQLLVKKVIALSEDYFMTENKATVQVQALVVGGPGQLKDQLVERLPQLLKSAVRSVINTSYSGRQGLREAINGTRDLRQHMLLEKSNTVLSSIFEKLRVDEPDMVCFGDEVRAAMEDGAVKVVVLWDESPELAYFTENCPEGTELMAIPNTTNNTQMLISTFGGIAALNKYPRAVPNEEEAE